MYRLSFLTARFLRRTVLDNRFIPITPTAKQAVFLTLPVHEALYGGSAGGGKSVALLAAALQFVDVPGYRALLLRRSYSDLNLPEALIPMSHAWLGESPARWNGRLNEWTFPSGATLTFGYLDTDLDKYRYQGAAFQFCVARGTPVRMADGSYRAIEQVKIGDFVTTLSGPRRVTRAFPPRWKKSVVASVWSGGRLLASQVQSRDHALLTSEGWVSRDMFCESRPSLFSSPTWPRTFGKSAKPSLPTYQLPSRRLAIELQHTSSRRLSAAEQPYLDRGSLPRHETVPGDAWPDALVSTLHRGFPVCCSVDYRPGDERARLVRADVPAYPLQPIDVVLQSPMHLTTDARDKTRTRSHLEWPYVHPYTMERRRTQSAHTLASLSFADAGVSELFDLTVEGESHYITSGGFINKNCGFDELTQFQESQYRYLFSRLRRVKSVDVPLRMRAATNPGGVGHDWVRRRFIDTPNDTRGGSRRFVPAQLEDNPHLDAVAYDAALRQLDPVTRQQLRFGDWLAHADGLFPRSWFQYYRKTEIGYELHDRVIRADECSRFGTVDVAGTEQRSAGHDPDWTVIQVWDLSPTGELILVDQWRKRVSTPDVESAVLRMIRLHEIPWLGIETAGLGLGVMQSLKRRGIAVRPLRAVGNKIVRSQSAQIRMEAKSVFFPTHADWLAEFESELALFPNGPHDDQVDALSYAALWAQRAAGPVKLAVAMETS